VKYSARNIVADTIAGSSVALSRVHHVADALEPPMGGYAYQKRASAPMDTAPAYAILLCVRCGDFWDGAIVVHASARVKDCACGAGGGRCSGSVSPGHMTCIGLDSRFASER
jgi:hypothetical protein